MPPGMTEEKAGIVLAALHNGQTRGQISAVVGVSKRAITRIRSNVKKYGTPKPPPSGAKLGRPVKLTEAQQKAIVCWMAERDHTFYVKDLVAYLKDQYRFKGCDGTIRRALVKAGYSRKMPYRKSAVTVWVPPINPQWVTSTKKKKKPVVNGQKPIEGDQAASDEDGEDEEMTHDQQQLPPQEHYDMEQQIHSEIDPALEQQTYHAVSGDQTHLQNPYLPYQPATQDRNISANAFAYQEADGGYHMPPHPMMHPQQQRELMQQSHDAVRMSQASAHQVREGLNEQSLEGNPISGSKSKAKPRAPRKSQTIKSDAQDLHPLQSELQRMQNELQESKAEIARMRAQMDGQAYPSDQQHHTAALMSPLGQPHPSPHLQEQHQSSHEALSQLPQAQAQHYGQYQTHY